jgi:hypothetical protein
MMTDLSMTNGHPQAPSFYGGVRVTQRAQSPLFQAFSQFGYPNLT